MDASPGSAARVIAPLVAGALLVVAQLYLTVPILPGIAARYHEPLATAAWVGGGFGLAFAVGNLFFGTASDRFDRRHVMVIGLLGGAVTGVLAGASVGFGTLVAARIAQGFLAAAFPAVALAYVGEALAPARRAVGIAAVSSSFLLAGLLGQGYALAVDRAIGWRWVFWLLVPVLIAVAATVWRLPAAPRAAQPGSRPARPPALGAAYRELGRLVRRPPLLVGYAVAITLLLTFVGLYSALSLAAHERYGVTGAPALLALRLPGLPGIALGAFAGPLVRRFGPHRVAVGALSIAAAGLILAAVSGTLALLLVGSAVFVAGLAVVIPAAVGIVGLASGAARGAGLAGYGFLIGVGGGVAPLLVGALAPYGFTVLCLVLAGVLAAAAAVAGLGPRPPAASGDPAPALSRAG